MGTVILTQGAEWLEILGYAGFDFACIDFMVTSIDWADAANMIRAANRYQVTPWIRCQSYPWGTNQVDARLQADVLRAIAIGAEGVTASVSTAEQVAAMLRPADDWHRRVYIRQHAAERSSLEAYYDSLERPPLVFPLIESLAGAKNIEEIVAVKGLRAVMLGLSDLTGELGHPGDDRHPEVRSFIKRTVELAKARGLFVVCNALAYQAGGDAPGQMAEGIGWLWDAGVQVVWVPRQPLLVQRSHEQLLRAVRERVGGAYPERRS